MMKLMAAFGLALCVVACTKAEPLPQLGALPDFRLLDQTGQTVDSAALRGKVLVIDFIFTNCPDVCPLMTEQLSALRKRLPDHGELRFVSFSVDPEHDTPARLQQFARAHGALRSDWSFLTGPVGEVKRVVVQGFKEAMEAQPSAAGQPANVLHGTHFVLVDRRGEIRGYYRNDEDGQQALLAAATALLSGKTS
ncbi:MAG TPA: SCO family protein [Polyangiales bacterium]|nr:SCO family protein [Polyangiales bacterium]